MKNGYVSSYLPIGVPADWTAELDIQKLAEVNGELEDPAEHVRAQLEASNGYLHRVLNVALGYYLRKQGSSGPVPLKAFTVREKLNWLEERVFLASTDADYQSRFGEIIDYANWVDAQRERLLRGYCDRQKQPWLAPLQELSDRLMNAGLQLEEALECEHEDYDLPSPYFDLCETEEEAAGAVPIDDEV